MILENGIPQPLMAFRTLGLVVLVLAAGILMVSLDPGSHWLELVFAADVHNNDINFTEVWQYNGTAWNNMANFSASGGTCRIYAAQQVVFKTCLRLNSTLAASTSEAETVTRANMTIKYGALWGSSVAGWGPTATILNMMAGTIWANITLLSGSFYYTYRMGNWTSDLAAEGVTYNCTLYYQALY